MKFCCRKVFVSNVVTGIIQAIIVASGAYFCKVGDFIVIFFTTFCLSFIPMIGAGPFGAFLSLLIFLDDRPGAGIAMVVVSIVSGIIDNIIRPYLSSNGAVEVPWIINFFAIIGGVFTMGLAGLFIGPLIASLTFGLLPIILEEYFPKSYKSSGDF